MKELVQFTTCRFRSLYAELMMLHKEQAVVYLNILMLEPDMYIMNAFIIKFLPGAAASSIALFCFIASCCFALMGSIACTQQEDCIACLVSDRYRDHRFELSWL
jgi:hypothetical protein